MCFCSLISTSVSSAVLDSPAGPACFHGNGTRHGPSAVINWMFPSKHFYLVSLVIICVLDFITKKLSLFVIFDLLYSLNALLNLLMPHLVSTSPFFSVKPPAFTISVSHQPAHLHFPSHLIFNFVTTLTIPDLSLLVALLLISWLKHETHKQAETDSAVVNADFFYFIFPFWATHGNIQQVAADWTVRWH